MNTPKQWLVFNVGCIECGVSSNVVGTYESKDEADRIAVLLNKKLNWREGGQNRFEVFDLFAQQNSEYTDAITSAMEAK